MPGLHFEDAELGLSYTSPARTITEADLTNFSGLSGDYNALHTDAEYMRTTQFGRRIAHGALILSIVTGLRARTGLFDGTIIAFAEIRSWRFTAPVFIGDTIHTNNEVVEKRETSKPDRGIMVQRVTVLNQRDEVVQEGEMVTLVRRKDDNA
jgi:acyl dehydratase